jgi:hypothetical protein
MKLTSEPVSASACTSRPASEAAAIAKYAPLMSPGCLTHMRSRNAASFGRSMACIASSVPIVTSVATAAYLHAVCHAVCPTCQAHCNSMTMSRQARLSVPIQLCLVQHAHARGFLTLQGGASARGCKVRQLSRAPCKSPIGVLASAQEAHNVGAFVRMCQVLPQQAQPLASPECHPGLGRVKTCKFACIAGNRMSNQAHSRMCEMPTHTAIPIAAGRGM